MTKSDLAKYIISKLSEYAHTQNLLSVSDHDSVEDYVLMGRYDEATNILLNISQFKRLVDFLKSRLEINDEITIIGSLRLQTVEDADIKKIGNFAYKGSDFAILPAKYLHAYLNDNSIAEDDVMTVAEECMLLLKDDDNKLSEFFSICINEDEKSYYIISTKPTTLDWKLYSYAYLCYVNEHGFPRPSALNFNKAKRFAPTIVFDQDNKYEQYFDVFGVMSESKYSEDILSRYLRMYQIVEYCSFRKVLADLTKGNLKENGFVRQVLSVVKTGSNNEIAEIKKGLKAMFRDTTRLDLIIPKNLYSASQINFLSTKLHIDISTQYDEDKVCNIIYKLRNCIVHNKESELHFAFYNVDDYKDAIDIMNLYVEKLEPAIVNVLNNHDNTVLEFDAPKINLY